MLQLHPAQRPKKNHAASVSLPVRRPFGGHHTANKTQTTLIHLIHSICEARNIICRRRIGFQLSRIARHPRKPVERRTSPGTGTINIQDSQTVAQPFRCESTSHQANESTRCHPSGHQQAQARRIRSRSPEHALRLEQLLESARHKDDFDTEAPAQNTTRHATRPLSGGFPISRLARGAR